MPGPFPGIDPYLEAQGRWSDFHHSLIGYCRDAINLQLPGSCVAQIGGQMRVVNWTTEKARTLLPDVAVIRGDRPGEGGGGVAVAARPGVVIEPVVMPIADVEEEIRETWIEVLHLPDERLVTAIEILSPTNKASSGRQDYLAKRSRLLAEPIHLVEIDLLIGGRRPPMARPLPPGDCYAFVAREGRRPDCEVYAWTIRNPLPILPVPLLPPDADV